MAYVFAVMFLIFIIGILIGFIAGIIQCFKEKNYVFAFTGIVLLFGLVSTVGLSFYV